MSRNNRAAKARPTSRFAAVAAIFAGFAATGVAADTLAQPKNDALERVAANYVRFREDVAAIEAMPFNGPEMTREAHRRLGAHDSADLSSGWVAYAALVAADTPEFAEALKKELKKKGRRGRPGGKDGLLANLYEDPSYVRSLDGADKAINAVLAMTMSDSARITALGETFKSQAYEMQKTSWGKKRISSSQARLSEASSYQSKRGAPSTPSLDYSTDGGVIAPALASANGEWSADWGESASAGHMSEANAKIVMDRVLNLAAQYSTGSLNPKIVDVYAKNVKSDRCLSMAQLTLKQCIAATRAPYEEAFCLGEHALKDVATCVSWVSSAGAS